MPVLNCLLRLLLGFFLLLGPGLACAADLARQVPPSLQLQEADFRADADAAWQRVALPDTWGLRGLPMAGRGQYRLQFELAQLPSSGWALHCERLSSVYRISLNGQLLQQRELMQEPGERAWPRPTLVALPAALLRAGRNEVLIELEYQLRGGLAAVTLGPAQAQERAFDLQRLRSVGLAQGLNVAGTALAALMLLIWCLRRSEQALGYFGLLWLLVSLRNISYYGQGAGLPPALADWLFFAMQVLTTLLLGLFALALSGRHWQPYKRALLAVCLLALLLSVPWRLVQPLGLLRAWCYPLLWLLALPALYLVGWHARRVRGLRLWFLLACLVLALVAAVHDYLFVLGLRPVTENFWMPLATPPGLLAFGLVLLKRLVAALNSGERLNQELEARVAERTLALERANLAKTRFLSAASHDLRQPVAAIGLLLGLVGEQLKGAAPAVHASLSRVNEAVLGLETLLRGLLDLSRLETPTEQPRWQPVALQPLFESIELHTAEEARQRGLRLRFCPSSAWVQSDPLLLEQMLRNLVGNALRYTPSGGSVWVGCRYAGPQCRRLEVRDNGPGIAASPSGPQGHGLGLAIVRRSAALLGHRLDQHSALGCGTLFSLRLAQADSFKHLAAP